MVFTEKIKVFVSRLFIDFIPVYLASFIGVLLLVPLLAGDSLVTGKTILRVTLIPSIAILTYLHIRAVLESRERRNDKVQKERLNPRRMKWGNVIFCFFAGAACVYLSIDTYSQFAEIERHGGLQIGGPITGSGRLAYWFVNNLYGIVGKIGVALVLICPAPFLFWGGYKVLITPLDEIRSASNEKGA